MKHNSKLNRSRWLLLTLFTLIVGISPAWGDTLTEDFESLTVDGTTLSNGWFVQGTNGYGAAYLLNPSVINNFSDAYNYSYELCKQGRSGRSIVTSKASNPAYIVIPVELTGTVRFYAASYKTSNGSCNVFEVTEDGGVYTIGSTSLTGGAVSLPKKSSSSASPTWQEISVELGSDHKMIAITMTYGALDDFVGEKYVYTPYQAPASISVVPSETSAIITWTAGATEETVTAWNLEYKKSSDDVWSEVHGIAAGTLSQEISGLNDNTNYDVRVKAIYGTEESVWKTTTFKTPRAPITSFPWSEDFTGLTSGNIPDGWDNTEGTTTYASYKWTYNNSGNTAAPCLRFDSYNNSKNNTNFLKTPVMSFTQNAPMQLKFWYKNPKGGDFSVYISNDGGATYTEELASGLTNASSWTEKVIDLPTDEYYDNVVIVFKGTSNCGYGDAYIYLDDVLVKENAGYAMSISGEDVSENTIAFGEVKNTSTTKTFTISNDGANDLTGVSVVSSDAEVFTVSDTGFDIAAGETKDITVTFVKGVVGSYEETITVSQANVASPIVLSVTGSYATPSAAEMVVKDGEEVIGETVAFGNVGKTKSKTITITNTGEADLNITSITSSNTTDFTVSPSALTVHGGSSETFTVTFVYDAEALDAEKTATITVTASNEGIEAKSFTVTGTRIEQWSEDFSGGTLPDGWIADNNYWTFADGVVKGKYNTWNRNNYLFTPLLIVNDASESLTFSYATTAGSVSIPIYYSKNGGDYTAYPGTPTSLANGVSGTFTITGLEAGNYVFRFGNDDYNLDNFEGFKRVQAPEFSVYSDDTYANEKKVTMAESTDFGFVDEEKTTAYYIKNTGLSAMSLAAPVAQSPLTASFSDASVGVTETGEGDAKRWNIPADGTIKLNITMSNTAAGQYTDKTVTVTADDEVGTFVASYSGIVTDANHYNIDFATAAIPNDWTDDGEYSNWTKNNEGYISTTGSSNLTTSALVATTGDKLYIQRDGDALTIKYKKLADENFSNLQALTYTSKKKIDEITMPDGLAADKILLQFSGSGAKIYRIYGLAEPHEPKMAVAPADDSYDFGMQTAATSQEFIVTNSGNADLEGVTAELTGDDAADYQVALSIPDGSSATINENVATVPAGQTLKVTATLKASTEFKKHNATLTIASTSEGIAEKVIILTGKTRDVAKQYVEFATEIPNGWTSNGWSVTNGEAKATNGTLRTTPLTIAANETMAVDARISNSNSGSLKVRYTTNNGVDWQETTIPAVYNYTTCSTYTFNLGNTENAVTAFFEFVGENAVIDNFYGGVATTAPLLEVTENTSAVANNANFDFGSNLQAEPASKVFTLANKGNASMNVTIAQTGDVTVTPAAATIAAGETADVTVSLPYDQANVGDKTGVVTITLGTAMFTLNFTGNTIDPTALNEELASLPAGWYNAGWTVDGSAHIHSGVEKELISEQFAAEAGKNVLSFKAKAQSGNEGTLKVYTSTDRKTWSEPTEFALTGEYATKSLDALANGECYYVKFVSLNANIDDLTGLKKVTGIEHDLYVSASNIPAETKVPETSITATATVYSLRADETGVYAKLFFDETEVATADPQDISLNGSKTFELTGNVPATEKTYAAKIVVYYSDNSVAWETDAVDVEVAHTHTLSITEFTRDGEEEIDANASNQFSAAFNVTVQNTGSTAATTPVVKIFIGETEVGSATADAEIDAGESKKIAVNVTNASAGEGGELAFTAKAFWTAEDLEAKATSASDVVITVHAVAPKFNLNYKNGAALADGDDVDYGLVKAATIKTFTITNSGTKNLELVSIVAPTGYSATEVTEGNKNIAIDGSLDIAVTLNAEQGKKSGDLVITYKVDENTNNTFTLHLSGRSVAANTWTETFDTEIPGAWTNNNWEWNDESHTAYSGGYNVERTLMTPCLTAEKDEVLTYDLTFQYDGYTVKVEYSTDYANWTEYATISYAEAGEQTFVAPAAGDYYLRFTATRYANLDNFVGFKLATTVPVTISQYGYTTFTSMYHINAEDLPDGIEAFYVKSEGVGGSYVRLTKAEGNIPAGTGLILKGTANEEYNLSIATGATTALDGNLMVGCLENTPLPANASSYVLINNTEEGRAEFQSLAEYGITILAGKAYLKVDGAGAGARLMIFDDGETTGISSVLRQQARDGRVYNLNGQRVENPKKGQLYIINGKQTVVK